jgi:hypothetical protein
MRGFAWMAVVAIALGCSGKEDSGETGETFEANCEAPEANPDCESGQASLFVTVQSSGSPAPEGTVVYAEDCEGTQNTATTNEFGEARISLPANTYSIWAEVTATELSSEPESHDLPGCRTTTLTIEL